MTSLELLEQQIATLQVEQTRQRSQLHEKSVLLEQQIIVMQRQANLIEQKDLILSEQSATIRKQQEKLAEQQLEINRLIQQAFGRRSERYLESPQQLKLDFGGGPEVTDAADGLQQAVDEMTLADEAATAEVPPMNPAAPPKKSRKKHVKAKMWACRGSTVPFNIFVFTVSRHRDGPDQFLIDNNFRGVLLGDCYSGYTGISLRSGDGTVHAACNGHARRKVFEARDNHPQVASVLLAMFQELYDIEDRAPGLDPDSRLNLRQQESAAVWLRMRDYLDSELVAKLLPKEAMSQTINYLNNHWTALQVYVCNAHVPIDNNLTEQLMKQVAIGRKNWCAPDVPRRTSGRSPPRDALLIMFV